MQENYLGKNIPKLGFGLMRLPMKDGAVDLELTKKMVDLYMERGFTYFDTAYVYINGTSEVAAKEAIVKRYPRKLPDSYKASHARAENRRGYGTHFYHFHGAGRRGVF